MKDLGNPFQEVSNDLLTLDTKMMAHPSALELARALIDKGQAAFRDFDNSLGDEVYFCKPIKKNKTDIFHHEAAVVSTNKNKQVLFSQLFMPCQARQFDLSEFVRHENQSLPPALSDTGNLYPRKKFDLFDILENTIALPDSQPECDVIIIDGAVLVHTLSLSPNTSKTFEEYAVRAKDVVPKIWSYSSKYERTDIVFDVYKTSSLKVEVRLKRGKGSQRKVTDKTKLPPIWFSFLRDNNNKTELFEFPLTRQDKIVSICHDNGVVVTKGEKVLSNKSINFEGLQS